MSETICTDGLYHVYKSEAEDGNVVAFETHTMKSGEAIAVVGPQGPKSTLMKCLGPPETQRRLGESPKEHDELTGQELVELRQKPSRSF